MEANVNFQIVIILNIFLSENNANMLALNTGWPRWERNNGVTSCCLFARMCKHLQAYVGILTAIKSAIVVVVFMLRHLIRNRIPVNNRTNMCKSSACYLHAFALNIYIYVFGYFPFEPRFYLPTIFYVWFFVCTVTVQQTNLCIYQHFAGAKSTIAMFLFLHFIVGCDTEWNELRYEIR